MGWRSFHYNPPVIICQIIFMTLHDNCMSKQFVNDVVSIAIAGTKCPCLPWKGRCRTNVRRRGLSVKLSKKTPQSARSGCQLPFQGSQGGFAARVARLATPTSLILLIMRSYIFNSCNRRDDATGRLHELK